VDENFVGFFCKKVILIITQKSLQLTANNLYK